MNNGNDENIIDCDQPNEEMINFCGQHTINNVGVKKGSIRVVNITNNANDKERINFCGQHNE
jgi:hypothetical protein